MKTSYVLWQSATQWHLSRVDGRTDQHTQADPLAALQSYCDENGLEYTIYPLENVIERKCVDTWEYRKVGV